MRLSFLDPQNTFAGEGKGLGCDAVMAATMCRSNKRFIYKLLEVRKSLLQNTLL